MKKALFLAVLVWLLPFHVLALTSTIDPTQPEYDSDVDSDTIRNLAQHAYSDINNIYNIIGTGGISLVGVPANSILWNSNGSIAGFLPSGDCTFSPSQGTVICSTVQGLNPFNASNITSGVLNPNQLPLPTSNTVGAIKSSSAPAHNYATGVNTSGVITYAQPAAADVTGLAPSATTDTTNGSNISSGTVGTARLPSASILTALLNVFTSSLQGLVPASGGGTTNYLRADGSWASPPGGGSGTVNLGSANQLGYYASSGTTISPATVGNTLAIVGGTINGTQPADRIVTGTSDTITSADCGKIIVYNNSSAVSVGIAAASTTGLTQGCAFGINNKGAGTVTFTPTTSTIDGSSSMAVNQNKGCWVRSDSTNYQKDYGACNL
jgi:hypothetical protein